jgi:hypothetical protein
MALGEMFETELRLALQHQSECARAWRNGFWWGSGAGVLLMLTITGLAYLSLS